MGRQSRFESTHDPFAALPDIEPETVLVDLTEVQARYLEQGYDFDLSTAEPGKLFDRHSHLHDVSLLGVWGSATVTLEGQDPEIVRPGQELFIPKGKIHQGKAGPEGWGFVAAYPAGTDQPFLEIK